jgi:transcriptional regulator with XRE-family HTH domain
MASSEKAPKGHPRMVWGEMLKHIREASGLTREELAARASLSPSAIRSYESGWRSPVRQTVEEQIEPVPGLLSNGVLLKLWDEFEEAMNYSVFPVWVAELADKEREADAIRWFSLDLVPGLMQTEDYARALMAARLRITPEEIEQRVAERMKRQEILTTEPPPLLLLIIDEAALHRPVGGKHVMAEQVRRLMEAGGEPNIKIKILPLATGAHEGLSGEFGLLDFKDKPGFGYQVGAVRGMSLPDVGDVEALRITWDSLNGEAASWSASKALMEEAYKRWTSVT